MIFGREPVFVMGSIQALIGVFVAFEVFQWTAIQVGAVEFFVAAILSFIVRQSVTPVSKLERQTTDEARTELSSKGLI